MVNQRSTPIPRGAESACYGAGGVGTTLLHSDDPYMVYLGVAFLSLLVLTRVWLITVEKAYGETQTTIGSPEAKEFAPAKEAKDDGSTAPQAGKDHAGAPA